MQSWLLDKASQIIPLNWHKGITNFKFVKNRITLLAFKRDILRKERILFIVNPISGGEDKIRFPEIVDRFLDQKIFDAEIVFSEYGGHASKLTEEAIAQEYDCVVAVGGDGTINEEVKTKPDIEIDPNIGINHDEDKAIQYIIKEID